METQKSKLASLFFGILTLPTCLAVLSISGSLSEYMWNNTETERNRALNSVFIKNIRDGTLDPTVFAAFGLQDTVYMNASAESWKIAAARETDNGIQQFLELHHAKNLRYANAMITKWRSRDVSAIQLDDAMAGYIAFERHVAESMDPIYFLAANIPCYKLWPWIGTQIDFNNSGVYKSWAENAFGESHSYKHLESYVDEAYVNGTIDAAKTMKVYKTCMGYEMAFFETAVNQTKSNNGQYDKPTTKPSMAIVG